MGQLYIFGGCHAFNSSANGGSSVVFRLSGLSLKTQFSNSHLSCLAVPSVPAAGRSYTTVTPNTPHFPLFLRSTTFKVTCLANGGTTSVRSGEIKYKIRYQAKLIADISLFLLPASEHLDSQCNFRRVKCSHEDPCHHCRRHDIQCTYVKASRGREITGRRISSLKRQHNQAFSSKTDRRRSTTDRSPSPPPSIRIPQHDSKEPASFSARRRKKGDLTIDLPDVETNTVFGQSSFQSTDGKQSFCREFYQQSVKQNHVQPVRTVPLSNPAFIPTSHLANFMESSYSKLAADPAGASRHLDTEIPLPVNLLNHMPDNVKATFPSFESFMGLPVQSIMPSSTRISQIDDWGSMHIARANSTDNTTDEESSLQNEETPPLSDSSLIPLLALYFERMHPIIPIFKRSWLFSRLDKSQHLTDIQFGALLIAMSAAALLQPVLIGNRYCIKKSNTKRAMQLLEESHRMHSSTKLGNNASIDAIMTSFYMFVILSSTGNDDAAWLRLSESVILAHIMKLHDSSAYENVDEDEREMRLRVYWLLTITERYVSRPKKVYISDS